MNKEFNDATFTVNETESQFELKKGDDIAFLEYVAKEGKVYLTHTSVPGGLGGKGFGTALVQKALDHLEAKDAVVMPLCSFVAHFIDNNPEYQSMLSEGYQM